MREEEPAVRVTQLEGRRHSAVALAALIGICCGALIACVVLLGGCQARQPSPDSGIGFDAASVSDTSAGPAAAASAASQAASAAATAAYADNSALAQAVTELCEPYGADVSVAYIPLGGAEMPAAYSLNGGIQRPSASMIKLLILADLLEQSSSGQVSLDGTLTMTAKDIVGGTGSMQSMGAGTSLSVRQVAQYMITVSDNTGANMLIDLLGMDAINQEADDLGLTSTRLERKMMDTAAQAAGRENLTSADDMALLLSSMGGGTLVDEASSQLAVSFLNGQELDEGLAAGLPAGIEVGHKTGSLSNAFHDGGIVWADKPYVLVVMTGNLSEPSATRVISSVSAAVYQATNG